MLPKEKEGTGARFLKSLEIFRARNQILELFIWIVPAFNKGTNSRLGVTKKIVNCFFTLEALKSSYEFV